MAGTPDANTVLRDHPIEYLNLWLCKCGETFRRETDYESFEAWYAHIGALLVDAQGQQIKAAFTSMRHVAASRMRDLADQIEER